MSLLWTLLRPTLILCGTALVFAAAWYAKTGKLTPAFDWVKRHGADLGLALIGLFGVGWAISEAMRRRREQYAADYERYRVAREVKERREDLKLEARRLAVEEEIKAQQGRASERKIYLTEERVDAMSHAELEQAWRLVSEQRKAKL
jgi:hypothetical protein